MRYDYDMLGNRIHQASMEAGERWMLNDVAGKPLYAWDSRDHRFRIGVRRAAPADGLVSAAKARGRARSWSGARVYGETRPDAGGGTCAAGSFELFDQAGVVTSDGYDFKGNLLRSQRQLARDVQHDAGLVGAPCRSTRRAYTSRTRYDALNRADSGDCAAQRSARRHASTSFSPSTTRRTCSSRCTPGSIRAPSRRAARSGTADLHAVTDIDYDAKGQRDAIDFGNGATTDATPTTR